MLCACVVEATITSSEELILYAYDASVLQVVNFVLFGEVLLAVDDGNADHVQQVLPAEAISPGQSLSSRVGYAGRLAYLRELRTSVMPFARSRAG